MCLFLCNSAGITSAGFRERSVGRSVEIGHTGREGAEENAEGEGEGGEGGKGAEKEGGEGTCQTREGRREGQIIPVGVIVATFLLTFARIISL